MKTAFLLLVLLAIVPSAFAEIYKCKDENGRRYFSDRPCPEGLLKEQNETKPESVSYQNNLSDAYCERAVNVGQQGIGQMKADADRNLNKGYITKSHYKETVAEIALLESRIELSQCRTSHARKKQFFECLSDSNESLKDCRVRYGPLSS